MISKCLGKHFFKISIGKVYFSSNAKILFALIIYLTIFKDVSNEIYFISINILKISSGNNIFCKGFTD